ncbi:dTDP-4-dehydrorhamnose reductase family protein [Skeletonema marinoi]|uniref:dTDP-4-dehydrorhamnose reductase family protein n=1 Tax=Skeletonema marinoi TaxID=267567 RepID=A0AAD9DB47_9STRA|nr:dTDP-4-dehydrorhamnose reductase family protein [Skeletonema marinoi]
MSKQPTVLITGASGMLGRALHRLLLTSSSYNVVGTGHSRLTVTHYHEHFPPPNNDTAHSSPSAAAAAADSLANTVELHKLDLLDHKATTEFIQHHHPDIIIHCAAQRYPDAFESNLEESIQLNVESTRHLAQICMSQPDYRPHLIYISTSYVFDGGVISKEFPPYVPTSVANPINNYGRSKWDGECAIRDVMNVAKSNSDCRGRGIIVRVPLLYGEDCIQLDESPALEMMKVLLPATAGSTIKKKKIDNWALRFPTSCEDVAKALKLMIDRALIDKHFDGTYHVSSPHGITKYGLLQLQSQLLNVPKSELDERAVGNDDNPSAANPLAAPRPQCTQLNCEDTWSALGCQVEFTTLQDGMRRSSRGFPGRFIGQ